MACSQPGLADGLQDSDCRSRLITICEQDSDRPVCKLLQEDREETESSIVAFLEAIQKIKRDVERERLKCARLLGRKSVTASIDAETHESVVEETRIIWQFLGSSGDAEQLRQFRGLFDELESLGHSPDRQIEIRFTADITFANFFKAYSEPTLEEDLVLVGAENLEIHISKSTLGEGSIEDQINFLKREKTARYKDFLSVGLEDHEQ